ncbi:MAG TPA: serine hydrolase domain-containing protein [Planctomycetota bacterium]|nr:serine hydrolase domain-containing protein [Planctomycetota bacterium]
MTDEPRSLPDRIKSALAQRMFPGAVVYVAQRGETLFHEAFGATTYDAATSRPIRLDDLFDLASLTKLYTTALVLRLVEQGVLRLDDPVRRHVPEVGSDWTIEDLLAHRTGTTADLLAHAVRHGIRPCEQGQDAALWSVIFGCKGVVELADGQSHYSDVDFLLAQAVCERAAGCSITDFAKSEILAPLALGNTCFCPPDPSRCVPTEVDDRWRHRLVVGEVHDEIAATLGGVAGHAGLFATAADVGRFCEVWLDRRRWMNAFEPHSDHFGLGWRLCDASFFPGLARYGAVGHLGFTGTSAFLFPQSRAVFVLLSNRVHPNRDAAPSRLPLLEQMGKVIAG